MHYDATVVIVTKDRKDELRQAVESALSQEGRIEVLVIDDGSSDGTAEMIREEYPAVRLERVDRSRGYIVHRNRAAELARAPVIVSIDDDAAFSSLETIRVTLADLDHPRVGAVSIPSMDVNKPGAPWYGTRYGMVPPDRDGVWVVPAYRGTAYAVRRELFRELGGYQESFFHQGEERDFCLRLLNAGFVTRFGSASPIHHYESPKRDQSRVITYGSRNNMLFAWYNVPMPYLLVHLPVTTAKSLFCHMKKGYTRASVRGLLRGVNMILKQVSHRRPVSRLAYRASRHLKRRGSARLEAIESRLPNLHG